MNVYFECVSSKLEKLSEEAKWGGGRWDGHEEGEEKDMFLCAWWHEFAEILVFLSKIL